MNCHVNPELLVDFKTFSTQITLMIEFYLDFSVGFTISMCTTIFIKFRKTDLGGQAIFPVWSNEEDGGRAILPVKQVPNTEMGTIKP